MKILGAVLAGGKSSRFGSDKAVALYNDRRLIDIVVNSLHQQVDTIVICGRDLPGFKNLRDRPSPGLGPLGGLSASLSYANLHGFDAVLSVATDILPLPAELAGWLSPHSKNNSRPVVVAGQHLIGFWPARLTGRLDYHLSGDNNRSIRGWIAASDAVSVEIPTVFHNINTGPDLENFRFPDRHRE